MPVIESSTIKDSTSDKIFTVLNAVFLTVISLLVLYPLIYIVSASFSSPSAVLSGKVWLWPVEPTLRGYEAVFEYKRVWSGFANSLFYTGVGTLINVAITVTGAYALSRKDLKGRQ